MPYRSVIYPNGKRKTSDKRHPTIYYNGTFSKDRNEINGTWQFKLKPLFGFIPIPFKPDKGTWSMTLQ